jgi:thymidylate synthase (FAD)
MKVVVLAHTTNPIETIYRAFRICYSKDAPTEIKIPSEEKMKEFIYNHLDHESPLEHVNFTFAIEGVSRITEQQLTRHRLASYSIQSGRYVNKSTQEVNIPPSLLNNQKAFSTYMSASEVVRHTYDELVALGIPKEDARFINSQGQGTNIIATMNVRTLINFFGERICIRSQWEIRELAEKMFVGMNDILDLFTMNDMRKCGHTCTDCADGKTTCH